MSKRPVKEKQVRRIEKALSRRSLPKYIDLFKWLRDRDYADTNGQARKLLLDGRVKADSHVVGRIEMEILGKKEVFVDRFLPDEQADSLRVVDV